jgi:exodeoxyribonuclease V gamma subunit
MGFHLCRSNRLELLADALGEMMRDLRGRQSPLAAETVIVQSRGMQRWLSQQLGVRLGIAMHIEFPFPVRFAQRVLDAALGATKPADPMVEQRSATPRELMPWQILALLPKVLSREAFAALARYVAGETRSLKEWQLAQQISVTFDRYIAYRPELLREWDTSGRSESAPWQAQLWHLLVTQCGAPNVPARARELRERITRGLVDRETLPARVAVFGISQLPPLYLGLLGELSQIVDVHWFQLEPTDLYWGDIRSPREQDRIMRRAPAAARSAEALHLETGHPLLASMGRLGRAFAAALLDLEPVSERELFAPPECTSLLRHLQANIYALNAASGEKTIIAKGDRSIQVHCCHSPMRELEVLHDQLLALFDADPSLHPRDILVSTPDMSRYAPYIEAVFGAPESQATAIPFTIADRTARAENCVTDSFFQILELAGSRFTAPAVLALLEARAIHKKFGLAESDLDLIRSWIERTGIRWGIDAAHRAGFGLPAFDDNSWRAGLRRLLLGYALPGDGRTLFSETLPVAEIEGDLAIVLGALVEFAEALFAANETLLRSRPLSEWTGVLREILHTFLDEGEESAAEMRQLRALLEGLGVIEEQSGFHGAVGLEVVRAHLLRALEANENAHSFLAGGVTFCALKPMRSIPFKVICLIGMDDTAFPRSDPRPGFDLIAEEPRPGDPSRRDDDRQIFLEALLSARDALHISYCGLSPKDDTELPPSVVVDELLDHLRDEFFLADGEELVIRHPLQAFSARYFAGDDRLFTYSREHFRASARMHAPRTDPPPFALENISSPGPEWRTVDLTQLRSFFAHPARHFLRARLQLRLPEEAAPLDEREPMSFAGLARYQLEETLVRAMLDDGAGLDARSLARATGSLPPGWAGELSQREMQAALAELVASVGAALSQKKLPPLSFDLAIGEWQLVGTLHDVYAEELVRFRPAVIRPKDFLRAWIDHLVLNLLAPGNGPRATLLFGKDDARRFPPVENARETLATLLEAYDAGLRAPLAFFPASSWGYMERRSGLRRGSRTPREEAWHIWRGSDRTQGEQTDPYMALCFRGVRDPFTPAWEALTIKLLEPLMDALSRGSTVSL